MRTQIVKLFAFTLAGLGLTALASTVAINGTLAMVLLLSTLVTTIIYNQEWVKLPFKFLIFGYTAIAFGFGINGVIAASTMSIVTSVLLITLGITFVMAILGYIFPKFFKSLGPTLFLGVILLIIAMLVQLVFGLDFTWIHWISVALFTGLIGFDIQHTLHDSEHTTENALTGAFNLYLNILNIFLSLMELLNSDDQFLILFGFLIFFFYLCIYNHI